MFKILVIRNDKLGDFMLAWPALALLKKQYPDSNITILIPSYTKAMAEACPWVDNIILDDIHDSTVSDALHLSKVFKQKNFNLSISLFSEMRTALALWLARIPARYGPATKLAQVFLNNRTRQKRSLSLKPEYEYNIDLIYHFISSNGDMPVDMPHPPYLQFDPQVITNLKKVFKITHNIDPKVKLVLIHAGSGGSAINLSLQQYAELAGKIYRAGAIYFVLTAGPGETDIANELSRLMVNIDHSVYDSANGILNFSKLISTCDLFISGSTGPLHIAGALNVNTAAFYPARRSATPLRWLTINDEKNRIYFSPDRYTGQDDMQKIDVTKSAKSIIDYFNL